MQRGGILVQNIKKIKKKQVKMSSECEEIPFVEGFGDQERD